MVVNHKLYNKQLYFFLFIFLLIIATVLIIGLNYTNRIFLDNLLVLSIVIVLVILLIIGAEWFMRLGVDEGMHLGKYRKNVIAFLFFIKNYFIVFLFTVLTRQLTIYTIIFFYQGEKISKSLFNILFLTTFTLSFVLYVAYINSKLPQWLRIAQMKMRVSKKDPIQVIEEESYKRDVIKWIDVLSIFFTVLILTNSTYVTYVPVELDSGEDFIRSFEANLLLIALPFYVLTAYHILNSRP